jgi:predicted phosphodiesterase
MKPKTCKFLCLEWFEQYGEEALEDLKRHGIKATNDRLADYATKQCPETFAMYSWESVKKWLTKVRAGEARRDNTLAPRPEMVMPVRMDQPTDIEPDLNPLGVLDEEIKRIMFDVPETYASYDPPIQIRGVKLLGIASDIHFPLHDRQAVLAAFSKFKELNIDGLYLNGDIMDCGGVTHHARRRVATYTWVDELAVGIAFFKSLRVLFPDIPIWYKMGNHEDWLPRYLARVAPEIASTYGLSQALGLDALKIQVVESHQVAQFGKLWIAHGHEIGLKGGTLNIARQVLMRTNVNTLCGHWHKNDQHERRNMDETVVSAWVTGCLSDLHPDYAPANQMTHGIATATMLSDDGAFMVKPYKIIHGRVIG